MCDSKKPYFTNEADIISAFENFTSDHFDERTLRSWIYYFKKCMYYASADYSNPMFLSLTYDAVKKSDRYPQEFLYLHRLMYKFLCSKTNNYLEFIPYTDIAYDYEFVTFTWNVPAHIMPFLIAYIRAANNFKKNNPIISFFDELKKPFLSPNFQNDITQNKYLYLIDKTLCSSYFFTLEEIYHTFAKNAGQKEMLWHCTFYLSLTLTESSPDSPDVSEKIYLLLTVLKEKLYAAASKNNKWDLSLLYPHSEPWHIQGETALMQNIKETLSSFQQKLFSFISENLDANTPYHIAAKNYEAFSDGCTALLNEAQQLIEICKENISCFYFNVIHYPTIQKAIKLGELKPDYKKLYHCRDLLIDALPSYFNSISNQIKVFKNKVKKASRTCAQQYKTLIIGKNYFEEFKQSVEAILHNLYGSNFMTIFKSSSPFLSYNHPGLVSELTYPNMLAPKDFLSLTYELTDKKNLPPESYIGQHYLNIKLKFPISLTDFLLKFDDFIASLTLR